VAKHQLDETAWLSAIVESADEAIISTDLHGIISSWNPAAERIYGYAAHEAIGEPNTLIIPPDRFDEEEETLRLVAAGQSVPRSQG
jgi:PAS domain S-box-containing protein